MARLLSPMEYRFGDGSGAGLVQLRLWFGLLLVLVLLAFTDHAQAQCYETDWFSEEGQASAFCRNGYAVKGVRCGGGWCDNKRLQCCRYTGGTDRQAQFQWSRRFSEEGPENYAITRSGYVAGLSCYGRRCDDLMMNFLYSPAMRNSGRCRFMPPFSEEQGLRSCPGQAFVSGIRCSGGWCDNLSLYCCERQ